VASEPIEQEAERAARGLAGGRATSQARAVRERLEPAAGLLRYATVSADNRRSEQLDPATVVDRLVAGLLRSLRGDPDDRSGRVQLQLAKLAPELRENVLETMRQRIPSSDFAKVMDLVGTLDAKAGDPPIDSHESPEPVDEPDPAGDQDDREREQASHAEVLKADSEDQKAEKAEKSKAESEAEAEKETAHASRDGKTKPEKPADDTQAEQKPQQDSDKDGEQHHKERHEKDTTKKKQVKGKAAQAEEEQKEGAKEAQQPESGKEKVPGTPGAQPAPGAIPAAGAAVSAGGGGGGLGGGAAGAGAVDDAAFALDSPLLHHGLLRRKGQQKHDKVPPGEEPIGLPADATAEVQAPPEVAAEAQPATAAPASAPASASASAPTTTSAPASAASDGLPASDMDVSNVPGADQLALDPTGQIKQPAVPSFPAPPKDDTIDPDVPPEQESRQRTADYRAEQAQEQHEGTQAQEDSGQIGPDALENEPDTEPAAGEPAAGPREAGPAEPGPAEQPAPAEPEEKASPDNGELSEAAERGQAPGGPEVDEASGVPETGAPGAAEPDQQADAAGPDDTGPDAAQQDPSAAGAPPADGSLEPGGGGCGGAPAAAGPDTDDASKGCGGGGGGGGAAAAPPAPAPPAVATQEPQAALATVSTLPPAQMQTTIDGVDQAVQTSVGKDQAQLKAAPPTTQRPSGAPQVLNGKPTEAPPVATQVPKMEAPPVPQKAAQEKPPEKQVAKEPAPSANVPPPNVAGDTEGKVTAEEADRVQGSIDNIPTNDPALHTSVGPAPKVELTGDEDPVQTDQHMDTLHDRSTQVAAVGRQDAAQPLGEDQIYPNVPKETLVGKVPGPAGGAGPAAGGAGPAGQAAGGGAGGGDMTTATSVVAQQERGPQFQAAFAQGSTQMGTRQQKKDTDSIQAHEQNQQQIDEAVKESGQKQAAERGKVKQQADQGRQQWRTEQDQKIADANKDADTQHGKARSDIDTQATSTDKKITEQQTSDNKNIDDQRAKAEDDARQEKAKHRSGGGGFFGWVKSKISAAFNAICSAITKVFDAARKLVQGIISAFTKIVTGLIDLAAKAITGLIKAFAAALIALGDVLLAAFPGLRDKFRKLIEGWRDQAISAVNSIADALKSAVSALLSALGSILSKILDVLQAGLIAAVNYVRNQINNLITWAQQALAIFGEFASIIVDIAQNPGRWISNLGSAIKDGVQHFLFGAIVSAVKSWFTQKIESIIGLGKMIFDVLVKGCISLGQIVKMAWKALIAALPQMIIQLVIENVVAALIPAAAAVLKIIQGLVAAYHTISRIIAAISTFIGFLKAIKTGGVAAACKFAQTVAAGAVALIDFIANWLLSKLKGAASKVADKLKGIAMKIMKALGRGAKSVRTAAGKAFTAAKKGASKAMAALKRGAKKLGSMTKNGLKRAGALAKRGWNALKRGAKALGHRLANTKLGKTLLNGAKKIKQGYQNLKQKVADWWRKKHPKKSPEERLAAAVARIQPKVKWMLDRGVPRVVLTTALRAMRVWYRLSSLDLSSDGTISAAINPRQSLELTALKVSIPQSELLPALHAIAEELANDPAVAAKAEKGVQEQPKKKRKAQVTNIAEGVPPFAVPVREPASMRNNEVQKLDVEDLGSLRRKKTKRGSVYVSTDPQGELPGSYVDKEGEETIAEYIERKKLWPQYSTFLKAYITGGKPELKDVPAERKADMLLLGWLIGGEERVRNPMSQVTNALVVQRLEAAKDSESGQKEILNSIPAFFKGSEGGGRPLNAEATGTAPTVEDRWEARRADRDAALEKERALKNAGEGEEADKVRKESDKAFNSEKYALDNAEKLGDRHVAVIQTWIAENGIEGKLSDILGRTDFVADEAGIEKAKQELYKLIKLAVREMYLHT
jgi:hypothetical protein